MPRIGRWDNLPESVRQHLIDRMRDRAITIADLNQLRLWIESQPEVPEGDWYKDFGSFKICGAVLILRPSFFPARRLKVRPFDPVTPEWSTPFHSHPPNTASVLSRAVSGTSI